MDDRRERKRGSGRGGDRISRASAPQSHNMRAFLPLSGDQVVHCLSLKVSDRQGSAQQLLRIGDGREGEGEGRIKAVEDGCKDAVGGRRGGGGEEDVRVRANVE